MATHVITLHVVLQSGPPDIPQDPITADLPLFDLSSSMALLPLTSSEGELSLSHERPPMPVDYVLQSLTSAHFYFHSSGPVFPIDPDMELASTSSTQVSARNKFRSRLLARDGMCVANGIDVGNCIAVYFTCYASVRVTRLGMRLFPIISHLSIICVLPQYITKITSKRNHPSSPVLRDITDTRNGLLINFILDKRMCKSVAVIQVGLHPSSHLGRNLIRCSDA